MNKKDFEINALCDYSIKMIEKEIIQGYNNTRDYSVNGDAL